MPSEETPDIASDTESFLDSLAARNYSPKSLSLYRKALKRFGKWAGRSGIVRSRDVTRSHAEAWQAALAEEGLAPATSYVFLRTVRMFFGHLEETGRIFVSPAADLILPRYDTFRGAVPSEADVMKLLDQPDTGKPLGIRDRAFIETAYSCALRHGELAGLTLSCPDLRHRTLRVTGKGNRERAVPLGSRAAYWLEKYLETARPALAKTPDVQALWLTRSGTPLGYYRAGSLIRIHALAAGLGSLSPHHLRRACATHMLKNGAGPSQIQALLGHSDLRSLGRYLRLAMTDIKKMHERSRPGQ